MTTVKDLIGWNDEEDFLSFDLTEIQEILSNLQSESAVDLVHAERLQQLSLRGADILSEYLGKLVKTQGYLEAQLNKVRNSKQLNFTPEKGQKDTADNRKAAAEASDEVEEATIKLAKAKAAKMALDKKFDIIIKTHHYYKDVAAGFKRTILGYNNSSDKEPGW